MDFWNQSEKKKAIAFLLVILIAGILGGYFAGRWHSQRIAAAALTPQRWKKSPRRVHFMERLQRDLNLQADQRTKMGTSLRLYHQRMMALRNQYRPRIDGLIQEATQELRGFLDDAQKEKFDTMVRHHRERRRQRRMRRMRRMQERVERFSGEGPNRKSP